MSVAGDEAQAPRLARRSVTRLRCDGQQRIKWAMCVNALVASSARALTGAGFGLWRAGGVSKHSSKARA